MNLVQLNSSPLAMAATPSTAVNTPRRKPQYECWGMDKSGIFDVTIAASIGDNREEIK